jgi:hypothetical protein
MLNGRRQPSLARTSRVNREVYARFCGRLEVKFLRPTQQPRTPTSNAMEQSQWIATVIASAISSLGLALQRLGFQRRPALSCHRGKARHHL